MEFRNGFKPYVEGQTDTESQHIQRLSNTEMLIFKPTLHENNITDLTVEELNQYLDFDVRELQQQGINEKLLLICRTVQNYIKEHYEELVKLQQKKTNQKGEFEDER